MLLASPVPPMAPHTMLIFLLDIAVLLVLARVLGRISLAFGMPRIVGELLTGMVLGPSLLTNVAPGFMEWLLPPVPEQMHMIDAVGQIGLLLLVGVTGSHLDTKVLRRRGTVAARVSLFGLTIPLACGIGLGLLLPDALMGDNGGRGTFALFLGVAMCVTAIPVIAKTLTDMKLLHRNVGQLILTAGMVDDTVGWFLLSVVSAAATAGVVAGKVALSLVYLVAFVVFAVIVGRPVVRWLMRVAGRSEEPGPTVAMAVMILLAGAIVTHSLGMEPIFGAFVMGILIGLPGAADQAKLAPLRTVTLSVLAPIFLATAGLRMDLTALADPVVALGGAVVLAVAIVGKFSGAFLGARLGGLTPWEGLAIGAGMNARGVVEVIVALTGLRLGVLNTATYTIVVLVAIVTSIMAPPLMRLAMGRVVQDEEESLREIDHDAWNGRASTDVTGSPKRL